MVLAAAITQFLSPGIITALGFTVSAEMSDPQITPAGYAFVIWGVITALSLAYGIYQFLPHRKNRELHHELSRSLALVYSLFSIWLLAAVSQWLITTVVIFVAMFLVLALVFEKLLSDRNRLTTAEKIILLGQVAIYTGWTTVAIFANTASAIKFYGVSDTGTIGLVWQGLILVLALANSKYWLRKFQFSIPYGLTLLWALTGVFFGLIQYDNNLPPRFLALTGIVLVLTHLVFGDYLSRWVRKA